MIRSLKKTARKCLRPFTSRWISAADLQADIERMGVRKGTVLLVHSSLSSLGYLWGGPTAAIESLQRSLGDEGTLVFPSTRGSG